MWLDTGVGKVQRQTAESPVGWMYCRHLYPMYVLGCPEEQEDHSGWYSLLCSSLTVLYVGLKEQHTTSCSHSGRN